MKQLALFIALTSAMAAAQADVYKCNVNGRLVYSQTPCPGAGPGAGAGTVVRQGNNTPTEAEAREARARAQSEVRQAQELDRQQEAARQSGSYTTHSYNNNYNNNYTPSHSSDSSIEPPKRRVVIVPNSK